MILVLEKNLKQLKTTIEKGKKQEKKKNIYIIPLKPKLPLLSFSHKIK